ncbi:hypothetical protein PF005_g19089 [Phytophthora fragariae]|uniref:RxLR effector protein n=1 Tax=Phytophthora fragariae TaxID=53985 RepID=A0A6A3XXC4_9STRA|nr:hypothetical protein PF003_g6989 [Phytophthora fragariae]KAE8928603.1 hypothetical protein PF009_g21263 [Phytophthora fragariae]KAE8995644.1 hypothetical protein PF011_g16240 [Phytophthora fragariae]KAE9089028.1 hypothetical protein PF010_g19160 [Phytophthora fragariae]KAE9090587.1 hypothetical protein PF007_g19180 [Phytophthora fragariae]
MRLLYSIAFAVATGLLHCSDGTEIDKNVQVSQRTILDAPPLNHAQPTDQNPGVGKRFLRATSAETLGGNGGVESTGSSYKASSPINMVDSSSYSACGSSDQEERAIKLPNPIAKLVKLIKGKKVPSVATDLLKSRKDKITPAKLRVKMLEKLPPELAAELIFLKPPKRLLPTKVPAKLPSKLPSKIKAQAFKIPGVADVTIRLQMEVWFYYRMPPTFVFRKLGLVGIVGKDSDKLLHAHPNYKYFKSYFDAWYKAQQHLIF